MADPIVNNAFFQEAVWTGKYPLIKNKILWRKLLANYAILGLALYISLFVILSSIFIITSLDPITSILLGLIAPLMIIAMIIWMPIAYHIISMLWVSGVKHGVDATYVVNNTGVGCILKGFRLLGPHYPDLEYFNDPDYWGSEVNYLSSYADIHDAGQKGKSTFQLIEWPKVKCVHLYPDKLAIEVRGELLRMPVILFCTGYNYESIVQLIYIHVDHSLIRAGETIFPTF
ncbi:hypothetical protein MCP_2092 [Methanocella paludicola SANAE]|uniref:Uncharacterized protein n=1 Tax=Methanocella paludicola (strain DSM 17711 / JCM 13418 / NBRC 101707 / SANAE) TaxID=304371 RepID=D1Z0E2_METPS|nr:hypothetical protein [Methanocella paludicola]BAI62164.1 hypothetical protein MCP_2092 [Methanocella paludicola SANAE]